MYDDEIARSIELKPIGEIAADLGVPEGAVTCYGRYKAKIDPVDTMRPDAKLVLVTAITPTARGEGKTTVAIGLGDGLRHLGERAVVCLREPSLGPCFGVKGGATGAGRAQVAPRDDINLHFTGDFHAVASANNLLAALVDHHLLHGSEPVLDPERISWRRTIDSHDRALREVRVGLGGAANGVPRSDGFDVVSACEVMATLCLSADRADLEARLARMIVGYTAGDEPVCASDLGATGAMSALLRDALAPNLVQTLEHSPVLVHGGPFANIAHGCNSLIATRTAMALGDYVVTEAGFGADLGAEKFFNIKCRQGGLTPALAVVVVTVESLKGHGGAAPERMAEPDPAAVRRGIPNLLHHMDIVGRHGLPLVVAINRYASDSDTELAAIQDAVRAAGATAVASDHWARGGRGAEALAAEVVSLAKGSTAATEGGFRLLYPDDMPLLEKVETIATQVYGATGIELGDGVREQFERLESAGFGRLAICMAKTPQSLSADPKRKGVPGDFAIPIRDVRLAAGAGFVVVLAGKVYTMPGLPARPIAREIFVNALGEIEGLR